MQLDNVSKKQTWPKWERKRVSKKQPKPILEVPVKRKVWSPQKRG